VRTATAFLSEAKADEASEANDDDELPTELLWLDGVEPVSDGARTAAAPPSTRISISCGCCAPLKPKGHQLLEAAAGAAGCAAAA
jgi:hypothetical protein